MFGFIWVLLIITRFSNNTEFLLITLLYFEIITNNKMDFADKVINKFRRPTYQTTTGGTKDIFFPDGENIFNHINMINNLPTDYVDPFLKININIENKVWSMLSLSCYSYLHKYYSLTNRQKQLLKEKIIAKDQIYIDLDKIDYLEVIKKLFKACLLYYMFKQLTNEQLTGKYLVLLKGNTQIKIYIKNEYELYSNNVYVGIIGKKKYSIKFASKQEILLLKSLDLGLYKFDYKIYGFEVLVSKNNKKLTKLVFAAEKFNTISRPFRVDTYILAIDILNVMMKYQKTGVHNNLYPGIIGYDGQNYHINDFDNFNSQKYNNGFLRTHFTDKWSSQTYYHGCTSTIKNDILELGFILNWIKVYELLGYVVFEPFKVPVSRNIKSYFDYVTSLQTDIILDEKIITKLGKFLRRLDKPLTESLEIYSKKQNPTYLSE